MSEGVFRPRRARGLAVGSTLCALGLAIAVWGTARLMAAPITPAGLLVGLAPALGLAAAAAVIYRMLGLWTAAYRLDRNGFRMQWGWAAEEIPWTSVRSVRPFAESGVRARPRMGLWWPGCIVATSWQEGVGRVEFFAADLSPGAIVVSTDDRHFVISPAVPGGFLQSYVEATRSGVLEPIPARSLRPDFLAARVWADGRARVFLIAGLLAPLALIVYLALRSSALPAEVVFGFDPAGHPNPPAPQGRLLLLPVIGVAFWTLTLVGGSWIYRREADRPLSYAVWAAAVVTSGLLWGATLHMLAATSG